MKRIRLTTEQGSALDFALVKIVTKETPPVYLGVGGYLCDEVVTPDDVYIANAQVSITTGPNREQRLLINGNLIPYEELEEYQFSFLNKDI